MDEAFIIMQIGDADLDRVCDDVIVPAIQAAGLIPRRVDRDNAGDLLKAEIISFLERSQIIVADLTNERPNCYLEVGYAMGLGKKPNLILMAREDHHHRSPNYRQDGPRVHFDLEGYDLLLWDPARLDEFGEELGRRISRRLALIQPAVVADPVAPTAIHPQVDRDWLEQRRQESTAGLARVERTGSMEAVSALLPKGSWRQPQLLSAVEASQVHTFGWPIGIVLNRDDNRPFPTADGVKAEVVINGDNSSLDDRVSYDYWQLRQTGDFYFLQTLFEDERAENALFFDTRIIRTTELLLFLSRLYSRLEVPDATRILVTVTYNGLRDRSLTAANRGRLMTTRRQSGEDSVTSSIECTVAELQSEMLGLVRQLLEPVFVLFDFFELSDTIWQELVDNFVEGRIR